MANILKSRQAKFGLYSGAYIVVILAVLAAVNYLGDRYSKAYDSTSNKQFSLSDQTIKVVQGLKNDVKVTYLDDQTRFPQARDLLDRYAALSPKLKVNFIDPVKKPTDAKNAGYTRNSSNILIASGDKHEEAKSLTEEDVTGALIRSQKSGERNVCFVNVAGEKSIDDQQGGGFAGLKQLLERDNYKTRTIDFKGAAAAPPTKLAVGQAPQSGPVEVPKDCTVLIAGGGQTDYPQSIVDAFKNYVEGGGHALFMLDMPLKVGRDNPAPENAALLKVLADWGVTADKDVVLDTSGIGQRIGYGPEQPVIVNYGTHAIVRPLQRVATTFPLTRSLEVKSPAKGTAEKLIDTTEDSLGVESIGADGAVDTKKAKKGPLTIAAVGTTGGTPSGRWVVTGTSLWAQNNIMLSRFMDNRDLFLNMINWLSADEDLISIRPKSPEDRPLTMQPQRLSLIFWLSVVLFPVAIVGMGLATWYKRR